MPKPQTLAHCHEVIDTLVQLVGELQRQNAWLHERVTLNSKTSSKPPSSDGPGSANRAQRRASQRTRGAQKATRAVTAHWWRSPKSTRRGSACGPAHSL